MSTRSAHEPRQWAPIPVSEAHEGGAPIPKKLESYVLDVLGQTDGRAWMSTAPGHAQDLANQAGFTLAPACHPSASRSLVWIACSSDQDAVVRVDLPGVLDVAAARRLSKVSAAPTLLAVDPDTSTSVVEFIPGEVAQAGSLAHTRAVADVLAQLRSVEVPSTTEPFAGWVERHTQTAHRRCPEWGPEFRDAATNVLHAASGQPMGLAHGDLVPSNVIIKPSGQAVLIDPEPHEAPVERDAVGWAHRTALMSETPIQPHLDALDERLSLDTTLAAALLEFATLTYAAYRRMRDRPAVKACPSPRGHAESER